MILASISNSQHYSWGGNCDGWHLLKRDDLSVIQEQVPAGAGEVMHYHVRSRQFFYILSGAAILQIDDESVVLNAGEGIEVPPHVAHRIRNDSNADVLFLVISAPKSHGDRVDLP